MGKCLKLTLTRKAGHLVCAYSIIGEICLCSSLENVYVVVVVIGEVGG